MFVGRKLERFHFRPPMALSSARFMGRIIYCLTMYMFCKGGAVRCDAQREASHCSGQPSVVSLKSAIWSRAAAARATCRGARIRQSAAQLDGSVYSQPTVPLCRITVNSSNKPRKTQVKPWSPLKSHQHFHLFPTVRGINH